MPSVILEAMGCGLPVVASDVGGNNELVKDGWNGFLIKGDDSKKLADDLTKLIDDQSLRQKMGERSREAAMQYDWQEIMQQYNDLYVRSSKTDS
jgi:glycosyltransferase involved in cell wall biosynthesis